MFLYCLSLFSLFSLFKNQVYFSNMIWSFSYPEFYPVFGLFSEFFRIFLNGFYCISSQNWWFTSQIWYVNLLIRNFIRFPDFYPDFSGLSSNLHILLGLTIFLQRIDGLLLKFDTVVPPNLRLIVSIWKASRIRTFVN